MHPFLAFFFFFLVQILSSTFPNLDLQIPTQIPSPLSISSPITHLKSLFLSVLHLPLSHTHLDTYTKSIIFSPSF